MFLVQSRRYKSMFICVHGNIRFQKFIRNKSDLTKNNYNVQRQNFNVLEQKHVQFFKNLLDENRVITEKADLEKYNQDWMKSVKGFSSLGLRPKTTEEVSKILSFCNANRLAVCPQGGNTGIVGGSVPVFDEIVISTELMDEIIHIDEQSGVIVCQAGCILENLDRKLEDMGLMVPLDLGSKGSCHIGGNVSTNAGGLRLFRYGNLHGNILGLEVVRANGEVLDGLNRLKKDNTGYHLKHLFIGSEGTLGFITKVAIQCPVRPKSINVVFLGLQNFDKVLKTYAKAKEELCEILSAVEVIDATSMTFLYEKLGIDSPIGDYPFYLLLETNGRNEDHDSQKISCFLEEALLKHLVLNGTMATEPTKVNAIWAIREKIPEGFKHSGFIFCYDISLPLENYFLLVEDMKEHMQNRAEKVFGFGHLGDGNLHLQIEVKEFSKELKDHVEPYIFDRTMKLNGSISAEHGIGFLKANYLNMVRPTNVVNLMKDLKKTLDPNSILNPYKIFPWKSNMTSSVININK